MTGRGGGRLAGLLVAALLVCAPATRAAKVYVGSVPNMLQYDAAADGTLSPSSAPAVAGGANGLVVSPDGRFAYAGLFTAKSLLQFSIGSDGALAALSPTSVPIVGFGAAVAATAQTPDGRYLYVSANAGAVYQFAVGTDGTLTPLEPATVPAGDALFPATAGITVSPDGRNLYINSSPETVSQYAIGADIRSPDGSQGTGGTLSALTPATVATGAASGIVVSPDGRAVYTAAPGEGAAYQFTRAADGTLSPMTPASVPAPGARAVAVSPNGANVYFGANGRVLEFSVAADTSSPGGSQGTGGSLQPMVPASVSVGSPTNTFGSIAVSADGASVYAASNAKIVGQFSVGAGGALTPKSPPSFTLPTGIGSFDLAVSPLPVSATPVLSAQASASVQLGGAVSATASLSGAAGATGTITFRLFGPGDATCAATPVSTSTSAVSGDGTYASAPFAPTIPGTYVWTATYGGDGGHAAAGPTSCSATPAAVSVTSGPPLLATNPASAITPAGAQLSGTVNPGGAPTAYVFEYGTTTAFGSITTPASAGSGASAAPVAASLTGLSAATTYYYRLVATSPVGTTIGPVLRFSTGAGAPLATTGAASALGDTTATLAATVNPNGQATAFTFELGATPAFGAIAPVVALDDAQASETVTASLSGLQPDRTYYYRVVATNARGSTAGAVLTFNTGPGGAPIVATGTASAVAATTATLAGTVDAHGAQTAFTFAYGAAPNDLGAITAVDTAGSSNGAQAIALAAAGLQPATTYYYRLLATSPSGTSLGAIRSFTTASAT